MNTNIGTVTPTTINIIAHIAVNPLYANIYNQCINSASSTVPKQCTTACTVLYAYIPGIIGSNDGNENVSAGHRTNLAAGIDNNPILNAANKHAKLILIPPTFINT